MRRSVVVILFTTLLMLPSACSFAQSSIPPRSGLHLWYSRSAGAGSILGKLEGGRVQLVGVRYQYLLLPSVTQDRSSYDAPALVYTADLIPIAQLHIPREKNAFGARTGTALTTYGIGGYPMGLRLQFQRQGRVQLFLTGHTGLLYFRKQVPDARGKKLNFAAAVGGGLHISLLRHTSLTLEYRYHHLSNGFRGSINPGLDVNMLYLGVGTAL